MIAIRRLPHGEGRPVPTPRPPPVQGAHEIERFFDKRNQFRRVTTRYGKLLVNVMGFVDIAAIAIWHSIRRMNRRLAKLEL